MTKDVVTVTMSNGDRWTMQFDSREDVEGVVEHIKNNETGSLTYEDRISGKFTVIRYRYIASVVY